MTLATIRQNAIVLAENLREHLGDLPKNHPARSAYEYAETCARQVVEALAVAEVASREPAMAK